jgi:hypothetical protein
MESGLNFGGYESDYASNKKSNFRKAGDVFTVGDDNTSNNSSQANSSSKPSAYDQWMSSMGSQNSSNTPAQSQSTNNSEMSANIPEASPNAPKTVTPPASPTAEDGYVETRNGQKIKKDNRTEGQKLAANVRPEYAEKAAKFYDSVNSMNLSEETKGNVLTYMGGDAFLPDPEKIKAKWQEEYANRPELLGNIMKYMGGGAGKQGHNY